MEFKLNRILTGFIISLVTVFFYLTEYDFIFFVIIGSFILFDLFVINNSKINNLIISLFFIFIISSLFYLDIISNYILYIFFILNLAITFFTNRISLFFSFNVCLFALILFDLLYSDRNLFFLLIFLCFLNDSTAYIVGTKFRGPLIAKNISPNKTWSGTLASFFLTFSLLLLFDFNIYISILISLSLFFGDLYFSFIKRSLKIKDFSQSLSSHGGILDRIDSFFFSSLLISFNLLI